MILEQILMKKNDGLPQWKQDKGLNVTSFKTFVSCRQ